jgi:hypothetical protein
MIDEMSHLSYHVSSTTRTQRIPFFSFKNILRKHMFNNVVTTLFISFLLNTCLDIGNKFFFCFNDIYTNQLLKTISLYEKEIGIDCFSLGKVGSRRI